MLLVIYCGAFLQEISIELFCGCAETMLTTLSRWSSWHCVKISLGLHSAETRYVSLQIHLQLMSVARLYSVVKMLSYLLKINSKKQEQHILHLYSLSNLHILFALSNPIHVLFLFVVAYNDSGRLLNAHTHVPLSAAQTYTYIL